MIVVGQQIRWPGYGIWRKPDFPDLEWSGRPTCSGKLHGLY